MSDDELDAKARDLARRWAMPEHRRGYRDANGNWHDVPDSYDPSWQRKRRDAFDESNRHDYAERDRWEAEERAQWDREDEEARQRGAAEEAQARAERPQQQMLTHDDSWADSLPEEKPQAQAQATPTAGQETDRRTHYREAETRRATCEEIRQAREWIATGDSTLRSLGRLMLRTAGISDVEDTRS